MNFSFTGVMQQGIKRTPALVTKLRATFLKVKSFLYVSTINID
jgi:hypothetical protein